MNRSLVALLLASLPMAGCGPWSTPGHLGVLSFTQKEPQNDNDPGSQVGPLTVGTSLDIEIKGEGKDPWTLYYYDFDTEDPDVAHVFRKHVSMACPSGTDMNVVTSGGCADLWLTIEPDRPGLTKLRATSLDGVLVDWIYLTVIAPGG
jgi:hypothetical protein